MHSHRIHLHWILHNVVDCLLFYLVISTFNVLREIGRAVFRCGMVSMMSSGYKPDF